MDRIEPHIIIHLKINDSDINNYYDNRICFEKNENKDSIPRPFEAIIDKNFSSVSTKTKKKIEIENKINYCSFEKDNIPIPFESNISDTFLSFSDTIEKKEKVKNNVNYFLNIKSINITKCNDIVEIEREKDLDVKIKLIRTMLEFADANKREKWPQNTSIHCKWCCHSFTGPPISIPKKYINNIFYVFDCYCGFSCAAAHLFFRGDITECDKLKYYNLLHLLKQKILKRTKFEKIKLAPPQNVLKIFGGHLSVEDFRNITKEGCNDYKIYNIVEPSIISLIPVVEETRYKDPNDKNNFIPIDKDRMNRAFNNIKLKRKNPLLNKKKTLLNYMNLTVTTKN